MFLFTDQVSTAAKPQAAKGAPFAAPLQQASRATGVSFDYLVKTAERESRFNPTAKAPTSTATGMFQFLEQTWLGMVKQEGAKYGLASEAAAITGEGGRLGVSDSATRQRILALREDPAIAATMAGAFAARNGQQLESALGRKASEGELYIAHFLGAGGAKELITLAKSDPGAKAAGAFREAAAANRSIFFDRDGRSRSASEVYANLTASFAAQPVAMPQQTAATTDKAYNMFRVKGEGKPLHGLFRSNGEPVAGAVAEAWGRMSRRSSEQSGGETRVAFFPRDRKSATIASDAEPAPMLPAYRRPAAEVPLPVARPSSFAPTAEAAAAPIKRRAAAVGRPLDLMRFVKTDSST